MRLRAVLPSLAIAAVTAVGATVATPAAASRPHPSCGQTLTADTVRWVFTGQTRGLTFDDPGTQLIRFDNASLSFTPLDGDGYPIPAPRVCAASPRTRSSASDSTRPAGLRT